MDGDGKKMIFVAMDERSGERYREMKRYRDIIMDSNEVEYRVRV